MEDADVLKWHTPAAWKKHALVETIEVMNTKVKKICEHIVVVLGSLLSPKCCLSYPTKNELYMAWLIFLLQAELSRVLLHVRNPSSTEPGEHGSFYFSRLPDYQRFSVFVSMPLSGKHLLRAWRIMETLGHRNKAVSAAMAFTDSQSLSHDTAQVGLHRVGGLVFHGFLRFDRARWLGRHIKKPKLAGKLPLKNPRYSPCLRFGGYRIPYHLLYTRTRIILWLVKFLESLFVIG